MAYYLVAPRCVKWKPGLRLQKGDYFGYTSSITSLCPNYSDFMSKNDTNDEENPQHPTYSVQADTLLFDFSFA
jgi:hypothetical protein